MKGERKARGETSIRVLVVDDEPDIRELLDLTLVRMGLMADCVGNLAEARLMLESNRYRLCLTDMRLPDGEGLDLVRHIGEHNPDLPVAVITAYGSMENAVSALKAGAFDYLAKPVSLDRLRSLVKSAIELPPQGDSTSPSVTQVLLGESPAIVQTRALIERVARSQAPVYITGESGSGKELAASLIHRLGARREAPFIPVNCGAIPEALMESEFFGYRKGAFTGAESERDGFFQAASGGTLFLDEVADLPLSMQVKLLRAIQEKRVRKVGATAEDAVDVRIICATHQDLKALVEQNRFRQDLFYRLNVIELRMPSLRECKTDIRLLASRLMEQLAITAGLPVPRVSEAAFAALALYSFPGNVRELENVLERALALMAGDVIDVADLHIVTPSRDEEPHASATDTSSHVRLSLQEHLDQVESRVIRDALENASFNHTAAAKLLGLTLRSLRYRMDRLGLTD